MFYCAEKQLKIELRQYNGRGLLSGSDTRNKCVRARTARGAHKRDGVLRHGTLQVGTLSLSAFWFSTHQSARDDSPAFFLVIGYGDTT